MGMRNPAFQAGGHCLAAYEETRQALQQPSRLLKCSWQRVIEQLRRNGALAWLTGALEQ